jgi:CheY-like chemotaxis protein
MTVETARVLVIDDEPEVLAVMLDILRDGGFSPAAAADGEAALRLLETERFDVIVSDIAMPNMNGLRLLETLRRQGVPARVLLITAFSTRSIVEEALAAGAARVLEKPFRADDLVAAVREALARSPRQKGAM